MTRLLSLKHHWRNNLATLQATLGSIETDIDMQLLAIEESEECWTTKTQTQILASLNACPNGVLRMSDDIAGGCRNIN